MPAADYVYDGSGVSPANKINNEEHAVVVGTDRGIFPNHHPFFGESIIVHARNIGTDPWVELKPEIDYMFSPLFINGSARATGQEIFTYIVLIADYLNVRITYQALGQFEDSQLVAEVATTAFDRSQAYEWSKINGNSANYAPQVRDASLKGRTYIEVVSAQLEKIRLAIGNPYTSDTNYGPIISDLQAKLAAIPSIDDITGMATGATTTTLVEANASSEVYTVPTGRDFVRGFLYFLADNGTDYEGYDLIVVAPSGAPKIVQSGLVGNNLSTITDVSITKIGDTGRITARSDLKGKFSFKLITEI